MPCPHLHVATSRTAGPAAHPGAAAAVSPAMMLTRAGRLAPRPLRGQAGQEERNELGQQRGRNRPSPAEDSTVHHSTAQHSTAQHSTAQHSVAHQSSASQVCRLSRATATVVECRFSSSESGLVWLCCRIRPSCSGKAGEGGGQCWAHVGVLGACEGVRFMLGCWVHVQQVGRGALVTTGPRAHAADQARQAFTRQILE